MTKGSMDDHLRNDIMLHGECFEMRTAQGGRVRLDPRTVVVKKDVGQQHTIDALVAALEVARDELDRISTHGGYGTYSGVEEQIDAALALARGGKR